MNPAPLTGKAASPGIVVGKVLVLEPDSFKIEKRSVTDVEAELQRVRQAIEVSKGELQKVRDKAAQELGADKAQIFESHLLVLEDPELVDSVEEKIRGEKVNAEFAYSEVATSFVKTFEGMANEYMRERAADVRDVSGRVLRHLMGKKVVDLAALSEDVVLVAHDLTPSDTATMNKQKVLGFLTNIGGKTSHTAIMARTLEIPAILGLHNITELVKDGDTVAFDGETAEVVLRPDAATVARFAKLKESFEVQRRALRTLVGQSSKTLDGTEVKLVGNIGTPQDIGMLTKNDAEGVGLYRTEFLFMNRDSMPSEDEQYESYKAVLEAMGKRHTIIRTLDIGGDKEVKYLKIPKEDNPFLGYRALRYCLRNPEVFKTQLRALLRASVHGHLGIMFPLVTSLEELVAAKKVFEEVRQELKAKNVPVAGRIELGIMIEVPSAAVISDVLAKHCDFLSIGTNDLIQYTCAVDRLNERVNDLYDPYNPAVLRLIQLVIENGRKAGIWVGMCGEMAGTPDLVPVLLGMGLQEFSMAPTSILRARKIVREWKLADAQALAKQVLTFSTGTEIREFLDHDKTPRIS
jgi:phosphotransferase system enzyme I (PtsI)